LRLHGVRVIETIRVPLWVQALCAYLLLGALSARCARSAPEGVFERTFDPRGTAALNGKSARDLRALPGLGRAKARAVVDARFAHDPGAGPFRLQDLAGIGAKTEQQLEPWLDSTLDVWEGDGPPAAFGTGKGAESVPQLHLDDLANAGTDDAGADDTGANGAGAVDAGTSNH
jgi:hypothetical protein